MEAASARVPDAVAPPPGNPRFPLVDSLRALAGLMVFTIHAAGTGGVFRDLGHLAWYAPYVSRLEVCLPIFFAISGFLLYRPYVAARLGVGRAPALRAYGRARVLRILPAYWAALTLVTVYPGVEGDWNAHWWGHYLFLQEFVPAWNEGTFIQTWSLTVEVIFYALLPLFAILPARLSRGSDRRSILRGEIRLVAGLYAASVLVRVVLTLVGYQAKVQGVTVSPREAYSGLLPGTLYSNFPATFDWLALGMALAVFSAYLQREGAQPRLARLVRDRPWAPWALAGAIYLALVWFGPHYPAPLRPISWFATHFGYGVIAVLFLAPAVFGQSAGGLVRRFLQLRPLAWLGLVSYGFFLWHVPVLLEIRATDAFSVPGVPRVVELWLGGMLLSVPCAAASYYLLERPLMRYKRRRGKARPPALGAAPSPSPGRGSVS